MIQLSRGRNIHFKVKKSECCLSETHVGAYSRASKLKPVRECAPLKTDFEFQKNTSYLSVFSSGRINYFTVNRPIRLNGKDTCNP
jgi:hypothetical protein